MLSGQPPSGTPDDTQPIKATSQPITAIPDAEPTPRRLSRRRWLWFALLYLVAILVIGLLAFTQGRRANLVQSQDQVAQFLQEQFELGLRDLDAGQYELARQRFEAIVRYDPNFPGAEKILIEICLALNVPTVTPTPRPTMTPDPAPPEELFDQARTALANSDWTTVINKLLTLRSKDPSYRSVEADGMMYIALRNRGMELIAQGQMEEGLYDLSLAERFGPLDREAGFRRTLAEQYLWANSFFGLNWARAAELFNPLCQQGATLDSCPKYAEAAWKYGDQLWAADDPCGAKDQYGGSLSAWENGTRAPTATEASVACETATAPPPPPPKPTETPTLEGTPTGEFTPEGTPTETPTPTPTQPET